MIKISLFLFKNGGNGMKKYKTSMYNIEIGKMNDDETIIYNSYSGAVALLDAKTYADLLSVNEASDYLENLLLQGFLVPFSVDEYQRIMMYHNSYIYNECPDKMQFTIAPTLGCPLDCYYCFEKNRPNYIMSENTATKICNYIISALSRNKNLKKLHITWFGGEPLVGKSRLFEMGREIYNYCKEHKIIYTAKILTNGILLDEELLNDLVEDHIITAIQFTLDGNVDDFVNVKRGTKEQYEKLINNIIVSSDRLETYVRLNVTRQNHDKLIQQVKYILTKIKNKKNIVFYAMPVFNYTSQEEEIKEGEMVLFREELKKILIAHKIERYHVTSSPRTTAAFCGAMRLCNLTFGPHGEMYRCENLIGNDKWIIGNVDEGRFFNQEDVLLPESKIYTECQKCSYLPICWAGCPVHRVIYKKKFDCESFKKQAVKGLINKLHGLDANFDLC